MSVEYGNILNVLLRKYLKYYGENTGSIMIENIERELIDR